MQKQGKKKQNRNNNNNNSKVVKVPAAKVVQKETPRAKILPLDKHGGIIIEHEEFVRDLVSSTSAVDVDRWNVNPGNKTLFPWLSAIARGYENYRFRELEVRLRPFSGTTVSGNSLLAHDPDSSDAFPTTMQQFSAFEHKQQPLYGDEGFRIPKKNLNMFGPDKTIQYSASTGDLLPGDRLDDSGSVYLRTGVSSLNGEYAGMWVKYKVELLAPTSQILDGGSAKLVGTVAALQGTSIVQYGGLIWKESLGYYQGPKLPSGSFLMMFRFRVTGGGSVTAVGIIAYSNPLSTTITGLSLESASADFDAVWYISCPQGTQLNVALTTTGTVTSIETDVYYSPLSASAYHAP